VVAVQIQAMSWKLFATTFVSIFLAELGDKTQLATLSLAAGERARWTVFLAAALALVASTAVAVLVGDSLARMIPPIWIKRAAGGLFLVLGALLLVKS
jgi:putative Ca2+/H+ antiporter (TMEM165/GDT1 family)